MGELLAVALLLAAATGFLGTSLGVFYRPRHAVPTPARLAVTDAVMASRMFVAAAAVQLAAVLPSRQAYRGRHRLGAVPVHRGWEGREHELTALRGAA